VSKPGPKPFWERWNLNNWLLLPASTLAKRLHISERLAKKAKAAIARDHAWTGTLEDQLEADRGRKLTTDADLEALADAQVRARDAARARR
jgi:hypothetical protein